MHVRDVANISNNIDALVSTSIFDYVSRHPTRCAVCPKAACNQILPLPDIGFSVPVLCECCNRSYCMVCSKATGEAMDRHDGMTYKDFQVFGGEATERHVRFIRDRILTLGCPQCRSAFLDFDGCTSVRCGNATCNVYFCANCLEFSTNDSQISHAHIRQCDKNPNRGAYFVAESQLKLVHKARRKLQLTEYFLESIKSIPQRHLVLKRISADLRDLDIKISAKILQPDTPNTVVSPSLQNAVRPQNHANPLPPPVPQRDVMAPVAIAAPVVAERRPPVV